MNLVDDYLRAVAMLLPRAQRDDIVAELKDTILSRIEDKEAELGRPLTDDEIEAVLREIGHPLVVAARYRPGPQHIIGPTLYPYWSFVVKVGVTIALAVSLVVFVVTVVGGGNFARAFDRGLHSVISGAISVVGVATIAAWLFERFGGPAHYLDRWRVRDLGYLSIAAWDLDTVRNWTGRQTPPERADACRDFGKDYWSRKRRRWRRHSAAEALWTIAWSVVILLWWTGVLHFGIARDAAELRHAGIEPGSLAAVSWQDIKAALYWPVIVWELGIIAQALACLIQPRAVWLQGVFDLALGAGLLAMVNWLWSLSPLSAAVRVDSVVGFIDRMTDFAHNEAGVGLAPILTAALVMAGFAGFFQIIRGAARILIPRFWTEERLA